jgi:hypothetical protein
MSAERPGSPDKAEDGGSRTAGTLQAVAADSSVRLSGV